MTLTKGIGLFLIFLTPSVFGIISASKEKKAIAFLSSLPSFFLYIEDRIETLRLPLPEILSSFREEKLEKIGFLPVLRQSGWNAAIRFARPYCSEGTLSVLDSFGATVGKSEVAAEAENCRRHLKKLEKIAEKEIPERREKIRLIRTLGCTAGLLAVIFLL